MPADSQLHGYPLGRLVEHGLDREANSPLEEAMPLSSLSTGLPPSTVCLRSSPAVLGTRLLTTHPHHSPSLIVDCSHPRLMLASDYYGSCHQIFLGLCKSG